MSGLIILSNRGSDGITPLLSSSLRGCFYILILLMYRFSPFMSFRIEHKRGVRNSVVLSVLFVCRKVKKWLEIGLLIYPGLPFDDSIDTVSLEACSETCI
jgi:hypothetical protein